MTRKGCWVVLLMLAGCSNKSRLPSEADQMVDSIGLSMSQDQLIRSFGQPQRKNTDPTSGAEVWAYEPEKGAGIVYVSFNEDKVIAVRSAKLNRTALNKQGEKDF